MSRLPSADDVRKLSYFNQSNDLYLVVLKHLNTAISKGGFQIKVLTEVYPIESVIEVTQELKKQGFELSWSKLDNLLIIDWSKKP